MRAEYCLLLGAAIVFIAAGRIIFLEHFSGSDAYKLACGCTVDVPRGTLDRTAYAIKTHKLKSFRNKLSCANCGEVLEWRR
jgi:hypothetical protein